MRLLAFCLFCLALCVQFADLTRWIGLGGSGAAPLHDIRDSNYRDVLEQRNYLFVYFYSTSCRYCEQFNPDFNYLSALYRDDPQVQLVKANAHRNRELRTLFGIEQYPSLRFYNAQSGNVVAFLQMRTIEAITGFLKYHTGATANFANVQSAITRLTDDTASHFLATSTRGKIIVFITNYTEQWEAAHYPLHFYQAFPQRYPQYDFAIAYVDKTDTLSLQRRFRISNTPSLLMVEPETGRLKTFHTNSQNHLANDRLTPEQCAAFIDTDATGQWHADLAALQAAATHVDAYDGHKQRKMQRMHIVQSLQEEPKLLADEYNDLLQQLTM